MKILNINSYYLSSSVHAGLGMSLADMGLSITHYVPVSRGYIVRDECEKSKNGDVIVTQCFNKYSGLFFFYKQRILRKNLVQHVNPNDYDLLHAHSLITNGYLAYYMKKKFNKKYIVAVRDTDLNLFMKYNPILRKIGLRVMQNAERVVFLSKSYQDTCIEKYVPAGEKNSILQKVVVIPNGVDDFWINNIFTGNENGLLGNRVKVISVGEVTKRKNFEICLKINSVLTKLKYDLEFVIVGKIKDKKIQKKLGQVPNIKLVGRKNKKELLDYYREADIFILLSIHETFGLVYLEAMSQGLPVIYTKEQGFDKLFEEGEVGYSSSCFDGNEISDKIIKVLGNYEEISKRCRKNVPKFSWSNISSRYVSIYEKYID